MEDEKVKTKNVKKSKSAGNLPEEGDSAAAGDDDDDDDDSDDDDCGYVLV